MLLIKKILFTFSITWAFLSLQGAEVYPDVRAQTRRWTGNLTESQSLGQHVRWITEYTLHSPQFNLLLKKHIQELEETIQRQPVSVVTAVGRMPLPDVLPHTHGAFSGGFDAEPLLEQVSLNGEDGGRMLAYVLLLEKMGGLALFGHISGAAKKNTVDIIDVLRLQGLISSPPGGKLLPPPTLQQWAELHQSANPVYRFIALEKFDSVEQSPEDLLALYRECLFGACSYLEVRALEAITRNKDFREEVAKLLEEYIASNPPANDGTLPGLRNNFPNLIEGAKRVIATIRNTEKPAAPSSPQSDPFAQTTPAPKPPPVVQPPTPKAPEAKPTTSTPSEEPTSSTPWSIIVVLIVAAVGLLWLLLKGRK
jgi:hypothetical protein